MFELKQSTSNMIIMLPSLRNVDPLHGLKAFKLKLDHVQGHIFQILYVRSNMYVQGQVYHVQGQICHVQG